MATIQANVRSGPVTLRIEVAEEGLVPTQTVFQQSEVLYPSYLDSLREGVSEYATRVAAAIQKALNEPQVALSRLEELGRVTALKPNPPTIGEVGQIVRETHFPSLQNGESWEDTKLRSHLGMGKAEWAMLIIQLEQRCGIKFSDPEKEQLRDASIRELFEACNSKWVSTDFAPRVDVSVIDSASSQPTLSEVWKYITQAEGFNEDPFLGIPEAANLRLYTDLRLSSLARIYFISDLARECGVRFNLEETRSLLDASVREIFEACFKKWEALYGPTQGS